MSTHIIPINGTGGSGKDKFVELFIEALDLKQVGTRAEDSYIAENLSMIYYAKDAAIRLGWSGGKTDMDRQFLSDIRAISEKYNDHAFQTITDRIDRATATRQKKFIFVHCREPHNLARFKLAYRDKCTTLLIDRSGHDAPNCDADLAVYDYNYDETIYNAGTVDDLAVMAGEFVDALFNRVTRRF